MNFRHCEKPITFEISLGNAGNSTDGFTPLESYADLSVLDDTDGNLGKLDPCHLFDDTKYLSDICLQATWRSTTPVEHCQTLDKNNYYLQFGDEKPTMYVRYVTMYVVITKLILMAVSCCSLLFFLFCLFSGY